MRGGEGQQVFRMLMVGSLLVEPRIPFCGAMGSTVAALLAE